MSRIRSVLLVGIASAFLLLTCCALDDKPFQEPSQPDITEWASGLPDDVMLTALSIPGTHDSGTKSLIGVARCQNLDIGQQLELGVRYFDVRFKSDCYLYHTFKSDVTLDRLMNWCNDFLDQHPREFIMLQIDDLDDRFPGAFARYIRENPDKTSRLYVEEKIPTLGEIRGRIMILRRFKKPDNGKMGIDLDGVWPGDGVKKSVNSQGVKTYIEDRFFSSGAHDTKEKKRLFDQAIDFALEHPDYLCISFASISFHGLRTPWDYAWGDNKVSPYMNSVVSDKLQDVESRIRQGTGTGIIMLDYPNRNGYDDPYHIVERIANLNYKSHLQTDGPYQLSNPTASCTTPHSTSSRI